MAWTDENDTSLAYDYSVVNNYVYMNEDDFNIFSREEIECHQKRLDWEQAKLLGQVNKTCPPYWDK